MSTARLREIIEVWEFDPPVPCERAYVGGMAAIHTLHV